MDRDRRIGELADRQHGLVTTQQLRALGLSPSAIARRVENHRLRRIHTSVYAVGHRSLSQHGRWMAAVLAVPDGALTGVAAARLHGIDVRVRGESIEVLTPRHVRRRTGLRVRYTNTLPPRDVVVTAGIRVTTVARTIVELGAVLGPEDLARVIDDAIRRRRTNIAAIERVAVRLGRGCRGRVVSEAIGIHRSGSAGARSRSERRFVHRLRDAGVACRWNSSVATPDGPIEVDVHVPDAQLCIELDGPHHALPSQRRRDRERDGALREVGQLVLRVPVEEFDADPAGVVERCVRVARTRSMHINSRGRK